MERHVGYVVGFRRGPKGRKVWTVRVRDPEALPSLRVRKFPVASVQIGLELVNGMEVSFALGEFGRMRKLKAIDVAPETPSFNEKARKKDA